MGKPLKDIYKEQTELRDKILIFSLLACIVLVIACAAIMVLEGNDLWTVIFNVAAAIFMLYLFKLAFVKNMKDLVRIVFVYFMNLVVLTYLFYINGGINSGMPIYLVAGLILIILSEYGPRRYIALAICCVFHVVSIFVSYMFMSGQAEKHGLPVLVANLEQFEEVYDTAISLVIAGLWIGITLILVFNAYETEKSYNEELLNTLADMAITDELTNINNRRYMFNHLESHSDLFNSNNYFAMFDIDHFKQINDNYGHLFGDGVLRRFGEILQAQNEDPEVELTARYGGEEFVILFTAENPQAALKRINDIREEFNQIKIENYSEVTLSVSAGLVSCSKHRSLTSLIRKADECLYDAKNEGRNRVVDDL